MSIAHFMLQIGPLKTHFWWLVLCSNTTVYIKSHLKVVPNSLHCCEVFLSVLCDSAWWVVWMEVKETVLYSEIAGFSRFGLWLCKRCETEWRVDETISEIAHLSEENLSKIKLFPLYLLQSICIIKLTVKQVVFFVVEKAKSLTVFTVYVSPHVDHKIQVQSIKYIYS